MLAGYSTLLSPRHRLKSEASAQFQACHYELPSMSTQRLDMPCSFSRKDASRSSQLIRPSGLSVEKPLEPKASNCSLKRKLSLPPSISTAQTTFWEGRREIEDRFWEKGKSLKRVAEQNSSDESCINRVKRKRSSSFTTTPSEFSGERLGISQLGSENFWLDPPLPFPILSSGEEIICFEPRIVNPWNESVVTDITDKGDKDVETTSQGPEQERSGSSASSESHSLTLRLNEKNSSEHETGNGSRPPCPPQGATVTGGNEDVSHTEQNQGFMLVSLLVACVESISSNNIAAINRLLARLGELASPEGTPISRVTAYFTEALALRVVRLWPNVFYVATPRELDRADDDTGSVLRVLNHVTPILKFFHFTANEMLLRAFEGKDRVHIIDFDVKQGLQWPGLFQSLVSRPNPPSHVRITGIGESKQELQETGDRLAGFAEALNLPFEFHAVVDRLEDVRLWMLHVKEKETVAVNCILQLHKMLYDDNGGALRDLLGLIRSTNPTIVLMTEQEAVHNEPCLELRVYNSLKYYSAIFDSIDSSLPIDSPERIKIEVMFAREIRNIIACEGNERFERHESFREWRRMMMEHGGFRCMEIGEREMLQGQMLLKMYYSSEKYSVQKQGEGGGGRRGAGLSLSWLDQPLYTVSAWAPVDVAGSSSSLSQPS